MDILQEIVAYKKVEIDDRKRYVSPRALYPMVEQLLAEGKPVPSLRQALMDSDTGIIAEFKRRSPSKGWINREAKVAQVVPAYEQAGAAACSILTDSHYFGGYDEYIQQARHAGVTLPILYKNFVVDEYQLFEARYCGASAVLLIAACLEHDECQRLSQLAHALGLEVLLEMHGEADFDYVDIEPDIYGINNRNLGSFVTNVENSVRLAERLPKEGCRVSESGIDSVQTALALRREGFNGFLMGEHFMRQEAPGEALKQFIDEMKQGL